MAWLKAHCNTKKSNIIFFILNPFVTISYLLFVHNQHESRVLSVHDILSHVDNSFDIPRMQKNKSYQSQSHKIDNKGMPIALWAPA
jgi:hypothetical protein